MTCTLKTDLHFLNKSKVDNVIDLTILLRPLVIWEKYMQKEKSRFNAKALCNDFQAVQLGSRECLLAFCEAVQRSSPVGSFTKPVAGTTPGYASEVWPFFKNIFALNCILSWGFNSEIVPLARSMML